MSNFLTYRAANPIGCIFLIMIIISHLLVNKKNILRKNNRYMYLNVFFCATNK
jgi:hypothetical protein